MAKAKTKQAAQRARNSGKKLSPPEDYEAPDVQERIDPDAEDTSPTQVKEEDEKAPPAVESTPSLTVTLGRAWFDEDDEGEGKLKAFQTSAELPHWAERPQDESASLGASSSRKRTRDESQGALESLLRGTAPLLRSHHHGKEASAPRVSGIVNLQRDSARAIAWHKSGEVLVVGASRTLNIHHVTGKYSDQVASWAVGSKKHGKSVGLVRSIALTPFSDAALVLCTDLYTPELVNLATGQLTHLTFLDPRATGAAYRFRQGKTAARYPSKMAVVPSGESAERLVLVNGSTATMSSLRDGTKISDIHLSDDITDCAFGGTHEVWLGAANRVHIYDVRRTATRLREFVDEGSLLTASIAIGGTASAVGSTSGVVNLYPRGGAAASENGNSAPTKSFMNLPTVVDMIRFGSWPGVDSEWLAFATSAQANGLRLVEVSKRRVVPSFPDIGLQHGFLHSIAFNPLQPILSLGEDRRVVNYRISG